MNNFYSVIAQLKRLKKILVLLCLSTLSLTSHANQFSIGDVTIHYNAMNSSVIPAEVAAQYGIKRSDRIGLINISVLKNGHPVIANIFGHGKNLIGQLKELAFKEIKEDKAVYYIATFNFSNAEKLSFDLQVQAEKTGSLIPLEFSQQLFSEQKK